MLKKIILKIIKFYRVFLSPFFNGHCRFYPSCSAYAAEAVQKYGIASGLKKGLWRVLRCNPFLGGGVDLP